LINDAAANGGDGGGGGGGIGYIIYEETSTSPQNELLSSSGTIALTLKMTAIGSHWQINPGRIGWYQQHHPTEYATYDYDPSRGNSDNDRGEWGGQRGELYDNPTVFYKVIIIINDDKRNYSVRKIQLHKNA
jgi:hypothetical protein